MKTITLGKYPLPGSYIPYPVNKMVDWKWIVLDESDEKMLLLSRDVIDWCFYSGENTLLEPPKPATWESCYLRQHLCTFYDSCFTEKEKEMILTNNTGDHLFLLTAEEAAAYLPTDEISVAQIDWADDDLGRDNIRWWVDTVGAEDYMMQVVAEDGRILAEGMENDADEVGVRPAMIVWKDVPGIKVSEFSEQRKVYILSRPYGSNESVIEHAIACCKYTESACRVPVLDPDIYPQVLDYLAETGEMLSVCQAAGTPLEECEDVWLFCQNPSEKIRKAKVIAALNGIPVMDLVGVRLP